MEYTDICFFFHQPIKVCKEKIFQRVTVGAQPLTLTLKCCGREAKKGGPEVSDVCDSLYG